MAEVLTLRPAEAADARFFWEVNNAPEVRALSIHTEPIPWDEHLAWFDASLDRPSRRLFVAMLAGAPVGVLRFDSEAGEATISLALASSHRGRGLGTAMIREGCRVVSAQSVHTVVALVRPDNEPSLKAFARAGFVAQEEMFESGGVPLRRMTWESGE